jgi:fermentation-respiration switch protein FrsA (DUF1100 family)
MMKSLSSIIFIALISYLIATVLLYIFQRDFIYFPTENYEHPFSRINVISQNESIEVIVLNKGNHRALMYFGGNAEAVVANAKEFSSRFSTMTIYLVNYRGYGGSSGTPTESGIYADALKVYDDIQNHHTNISVVGRSLGSGVATYVGANRPVQSVALITPYDSVLNIAANKFPMFPIRLLLKDHYDSLSRAKNIKSKVLILAAEHDKLIPMTHTQKLINEFKNGQVTLKIIKGSNHNSLSNSAEYYKTLGDFI